jgi:serine/threonine protein kinase
MELLENLELKQIDRYEVKGTLGEGAMGKVLLCFDPKLHREVAVKIVTEKAATEKGRMRFHREARAVAALHHPNIVEIYDYSGPDSSYLYLVMERLQGIDLFDLMDRHGPVPEPIMAAVGHELSQALQHAHTSGVIHRDLKPENVYIDQTGRVVLTDFGIAKVFTDENLLGTGSWSAKTEVIGTPGFMSPEQMLNRTLGPRTDIFALGALLYNVLTTQMPFEAHNPTELFKVIAAGKFADPRMRYPEISERTVEILRSCLEAKPKNRPRSMAVVGEGLRDVLVAYGVTDLREDLREYLRDPAGYRVRCKQRAIAYTIDRLKVALKDKDKSKLGVFKRRILELDPQNAELEGMSGIFPAPNGGDSPERVFSGEQRLFSGEHRIFSGEHKIRSPFSAWLQRHMSWKLWVPTIVVAGVVLYFAIRGALYLVGVSPVAVPTPVPGGTPAGELPLTPAAETPGPAPAGVEPANAGQTLVPLTITCTAKADITLDGKRLARGKKDATANVKPGTYLLEVRYGRKGKLQAKIRVPTANNGQISVDLANERVKETYHGTREPGHEH